MFDEAAYHALVIAYHNGAPIRIGDIGTVPGRVRRHEGSCEGIALFMQMRQDIQVGGRPSKTQYQYTLQDPDSTELAHWVRC